MTNPTSDETATNPISDPPVTNPATFIDVQFCRRGTSCSPRAPLRPATCRYPRYRRRCARREH
eukprot:scaffold1669_cov108-Isochrysis_galbana.AAC.10